VRCHHRSMALRGAAARWWSLHSLGSPSRIVAGLSTAEFYPAAAATAAPRRSGLDAHDERVVSALDLHPHERDDVSDGGDALSCAERRASRGVGAVAAVTARSFQITPHSSSSARPAPTPTGTDTLLPPRWPASIGGGHWMSSSTSAPPGLGESGNRVPSSTIFVEGGTKEVGTGTAGHSAFATAIALRGGTVVQGEAAGEVTAGAGAAGEAGAEEAARRTRGSSLRR